MNNKIARKIQFGGWSKRSYKQVRRQINRFIDDEVLIQGGTLVSKTDWVDSISTGFACEEDDALSSNGRTLDFGSSY